MNRQPTAWQMPPVFISAPDTLLGVHGLAARQVRLLVYSSERFNTRATHILCCPREPRKRLAGHQTFPANRVRSATASGSAVRMFGTACLSTGLRIGRRRRGMCKSAGPTRIAVRACATWQAVSKQHSTGSIGRGLAESGLVPSDRSTDGEFLLIATILPVLTAPPCDWRPADHQRY